MPDDIFLVFGAAYAAACDWFESFKEKHSAKNRICPGCGRVPQQWLEVSGMSDEWGSCPYCKNIVRISNLTVLPHYNDDVP
jgi:hypothetical protein